MCHMHVEDGKRNVCNKNSMYCVIESVFRMSAHAIVFRVSDADIDIM